jgi:D-arabinose 1-dehydrogenase-like Zn-dependent alcohol dehydrogenase
MKAAVLTHHRQPLEIHDVPMPTPGPGDAVIRVEACGVCRSDWHLWQEEWTWLDIGLQLPRILGHEFGGTVEEVGREVGNFKPGDRVTVPFHLACGTCEFCRTGRANLCYAFGFTGVHHDGGYGEYACIPNADVNMVALPDNVNAVTAAALGCRFMTAYHAVVDQAAVRPGEWVAIFGVGAVGLAAVQIAAALGARVIAVSRTPTKLDLARAEGAAETVIAGDAASAAIRDLTNGGAHVSIDAFGSSATAVPGIMALRKGGRHIQIGGTGKADGGMISVPSDRMMLQELRFIGSVGCPTTSFPGLLSMVASQRLNPTRLVSGTVSVHHVNDVLARMSAFDTVGFNVITSWHEQSGGAVGEQSDTERQQATVRV